jgi:hypothetical protein
MKTQNTLNSIINVLGYVYLAGAVSSIVWTIKTLIELI